MGLMAGIAAFPRLRLMALACFCVRLPFMTGKTESLFIIFKLEFAGRSMAVMTCKAFAFNHGQVATGDLGLAVFPAQRVLVFRTAFFTLFRVRFVAVKADKFSRFCQEKRFITGMDRVAADTLLGLVRFVDAARSGCRFFMAVETELIGRGLGGDFLLLNLMAGITFALCHRFVQIFFKQIR